MFCSQAPPIKSRWQGGFTKARHRDGVCIFHGGQPTNLHPFQILVFYGNGFVALYVHYPFSLDPISQQLSYLSFDDLHDDEWSFLSLVVCLLWLRSERYFDDFLQGTSSCMEWEGLGHDLLSSLTVGTVSGESFDALAILYFFLPFLYPFHTEEIYNRRNERAGGWQSLWQPLFCCNGVEKLRNMCVQRLSNTPLCCRSSISFSRT